jgi:hypothetical protein
MSIKAEIAQYLASLLDLRVARKGRVGPLLEDDFLERFFQYFEIDCVFDVGANMGQYAKKIRRKLNYKGRIISFEPIPDVATQLRREAEKDILWFVEEVALDSVTGRLFSKSCRTLNIVLCATQRAVISTYMQVQQKLSPRSKLKQKH